MIRVQTTNAESLRKNEDSSHDRIILQPLWNGSKLVTSRNVQHNSPSLTPLLNQQTRQEGEVL